jgi:hypothetical protein
MNEREGKMSLRDEDLIAYLDKELAPDDRAAVDRAAAADPQVAARLVVLQGQPAEVREVFAPLLREAPTSRLEAMLDSLDVARASQATTRGANSWTRRQLIAASIALVVAGGLADHVFDSLRPALLPEDPGHWRDVVAAYVRLYTPQTLSNIPDDPSLRARELAEVGRIIGLDLSAETLDMPGMVLKRSQILEYDRTPLAEINYLDPRGWPLALCIVPSSQPARGPRMEIRRDLNLAFWNDGRHGFVVTGRQSSSNLMEIARSLAKSIDATSI